MDKSMETNTRTVSNPSVVPVQDSPKTPQHDVSCRGLQNDSVFLVTIIPMTTKKNIFLLGF